MYSSYFYNVSLTPTIPTSYLPFLFTSIFFFLQQTITEIAEALFTVSLQKQILRYQHDNLFTELYTTILLISLYLMN